MSLLVYVNGELTPRERATVSVFDHGFLYGDGVFEGIRAYGGAVFRLRQHIERLYRSAHTLLLSIPMSMDEMANAVLATLRANDLSDAYIRVVVSRGEGDLGLDPRKCSKPSIIIITDRIAVYPPEMYECGLELITLSTRRNSAQSLDPNIKSLNYLNNILGKIECNRAGVHEGLMLNQEGFVTEATADNVFLVRRGELLTPPLSAGILDGITRAAVLELAAARSITVKEILFTLYEVYNSEECFLTGTGAEVIPVVKVDGRVIGDGQPGPVTRQLIGDFRKLVCSDGDRIRLHE
ncbi:MAG TPA: branched-chain-amino-acid transaminase [Armatimonadota bacterium]|nr:branched-chain-amino-acid transaminase [Armatimonadota bacterium]